jgi:Cu+-exporting ATPase
MDQSVHSNNVAATAIDPVCGMTVDPATSRHRHTHHRHSYYFCSTGCRRKFAADPEKYLDKHTAPSDAMPDGTIYTCPMHPQIRQFGPGNCPICGMALEPLVVTADAQPNHELADMSRRFWIGLALTTPVFVLEMGSHIPAIGLHRLVPPNILSWI